MKKLLIILPLLMFAFTTWACPACEKQQPKFLKGIAHGAGPTSNWDYIWVVLIVIAALCTLWFTVKWIVKPGEMNEDHIKRTVLNFN